MDVDSVSRAVVDRAIEQAAVRVRTVSALAGALLVCAAAVAYVGLAVMADHAFDGGLSLTVRRVGLGLAGLLAAILTGVLVIRPAVRRISQLYAAWLLERARPELRHALTTSLQLRYRTDVHAGVSSGLSFQAARAVRHVDSTSVVSGRALRHAGLTALSVIVLFGVYGILAPKRMRPSVLRVFGADITAPTRTSVEMIRPAVDASVVVGTPVPFDVLVTGRVPDSAWLEFSLDEGKTWHEGNRLDLAPSADRKSAQRAWTATRAGADVGATFWYRVRAGDAHFEPRRLEVRPQPVVTAHDVVLTWPEYSGRTESSHSDGPIDALIGTQVELTVHTNVPAADGRVVFHGPSGAYSRQMTLDSTDRRVLRGKWVVDRDLEYEVRFNDAHGAGNPNPIRYAQRARGDHPPEIDQIEPGAKLTAAATDLFALKAVITDDWGVAGLTLKYRGATRDGRIELMHGRTTHSARVDLAESIAVAALGASDGEVVEFWIEAIDTRVDLRGASDPQLTRGPVCELRVNGGGKGRSATDKPGGNAGAGADPKKPGAGNGNSNQPGKGPEGSNGLGGTGASGDGKPGNGDDPSPEDDRQSGDDSKSSKNSKSTSDGNQSNDSGDNESDGQPRDNSGSSEDERKPATPDDGGPNDNGDGASMPGDSGGKSNSDADSGDSAGSRGDSNGESKQSGDSGNPSDVSDGRDGEPQDANAELDRLIKKNKDAIDRLGQQPSGESGEKPKDGEKNEAGKSGPSGSEVRPGSKAGDKSEKPGDTGKKPSDNSDAGNERSGGEKDPSDQKRGGQPKASTGGKEGDKAKNSDNSNGEGKPADDKPNGEASKEAQGESKPPSNEGNRTDEDDAPGEHAGEGKSKESDAEQKQDAESGTSKGEAKGNQSGDQAGKPGDQPGDGETGEQSDAEGGKPQDGATAKENSDGESKPATTGKQTGDKTSKNSGEGQRNTPTPAQDVGPTPKGGGSVAPDAGPGETDGRFAGEGDSEALDAPMRERARKAVDELERRLRDGGVSDAELQELGWNRAEAQAFVERYRRLQAAAQRQRDGGLFSGKTRDTDDGPSSADGNSATGVGRGMTGAIRSAPGTARPAEGLSDATTESVPVEFRDVLDEYYRSMARQGEATSRPAR